MKISLLCFLIFIMSACATKPNNELKRMGELYEVARNPEDGFNFPFFLWIPETKEDKLNLLVIPNNSGSSQKDYDSQYRSAKHEILSWINIATETSSVLLMPVFFRPDVEPPLYTHSLSRSTLEVQNGDLKRIDLQLIKMVEKARPLITTKQNKPLRDKIYLFGFSASAMFVNRFSFLHPELVSAIVFGAPGGWPLAPVNELKGHKLRYPIGIADLDQLTGSKVELEKVRSIPMFIFLGENDTNDSVIYRDGYSKEDEVLVFNLFGKTPVQRWPTAESLYLSAGFNAQFKLYKGAGHETNKLVNGEIANFFNSIKH